MVDVVGIVLGADYIGRADGVIIVVVGVWVVDGGAVGITHSHDADDVVALVVSALVLVGMVWLLVVVMVLLI